MSQSGEYSTKYRYDAFGNQKDAAETDPNPFRYCGEYFDAETGEVYLRARYYNSGTGRFGAEDPAKHGRNWYSYCRNSPILLADPSGLADGYYSVSGDANYDAQRIGYWMGKYSNATENQINNEIGKVANWFINRNAVDTNTNSSGTSSPNSSPIVLSQPAPQGDVFLAFGSAATKSSGRWYDLGAGYRAYVENGSPDTGTQRHIKIYKDGKFWAQNEDGTGHDKNNKNNMGGDPPKWVKRKIEEKCNWNWDANKAVFYQGAEVVEAGGKYTIMYPDGVEIVVNYGYIVPDENWIRNNMGKYYEDSGGISTYLDQRSPAEQLSTQGVYFMPDGSAPLYGLYYALFGSYSYGVAFA